jgi:mannosyltransferase OCH1-like enzyme
MTIIPKIIFQKWETKKLAPFLTELINRWKLFNPTYQYILYDTNDARLFIKNHFGIRFLNVFDKIKPGAYKADFWRYCILYIHGGVYVDIDTYCLGSLDKLLINDYDLVAPIDLNININEGEHNISNGFIMTKPFNPILLTAILKIMENVENNHIPNSLLDFSGPGVLGKSINKELGREETDSFIGMEGDFIKNGFKIKFLKFDKNNEIVGDIKGNNIFQNKNKIPILHELYHQECKKLNIVSWLNTPAI